MISFSFRLLLLLTLATNFSSASQGRGIASSIDSVFNEYKRESVLALMKANVGLCRSSLEWTDQKTLGQNAWPEEFDQSGLSHG